MQEQEYMKKEISDERIDKLTEFIEILKSNGINMEEYEIYLKRLIDFNQTHNKSQDTNLYELGSFMESLKPYKNIVEIIKKTDELKSESNYYVRIPKTIELINYINDNIDKDEIKCPISLIEHANEEIFKTIKLELRETLMSDIFNLVKHNPFYTNYFNNKIKREIDELKRAIYLNNPEMITILKEEEKRCNGNLFDKKIIILLIACQEKETLSNNKWVYLSETEKSLSDNNRIIQILNNSKKLGLAQERLKEYKKFIFQAKQKVPALILSSVLLTGASLGVIPLAKKLNYKNAYPTTTEKYRLESCIYDEGKSESIERLINDDGKRITLEVQGELEKVNHNLYRRLTTVYDVTESSVEEENPYYYINLDLSDPNIKQIESSYSHYNSNDFYTDEVRELTITTQDLNNPQEYTDEENYERMLVLTYLCITFSSLIPNFPINSLINILYNLKYASQNKRKFKENVSELENELITLESKILENSEISDYYYFLLNSDIIKYNGIKIEELIKTSNLYKEITLEHKEKVLELKQIKL